MSDKLIDSLKKHRENALEEIMNRYQALVGTIVCNISGGAMSKEDIEETVADVFVTLWNNADKVQDGKLKGYICCIAKTRALNKLRSVSSKIIEPMDDDDIDIEDDFSIELEAERKDISEDLREIINQIREPDREILLRYYYYYQNVTKIAEAMQLNRETVKSKLRRTREKLKKELYERGYM